MVIVFMLCVLGFRMAVLTIVEGEEYRAVADIKKIKDIPVKAPRGKIFDRNGVLLADNVASFTVQMYTDEIEPEDFNGIAYILSKILDENGERPIDDFPIKLDTFEYVTEPDLRSSSDEVVSYITAEERVIQVVAENLYAWLNYTSTIYNEPFNIKERVLDTILRDIEMPVKLENDQFVYTETEEIVVSEEEDTQQTDVPADGEEEADDPVTAWLKNNDLNEKSTAENAVIEILIKNNKYMKRLFYDSKVRRFSYNFISSSGLEPNIKLTEFAFVQDEYYANLKRGLNVNHQEITPSSEAKDDFVILTMKYSLDNLLLTVYQADNGKIMPGAVLVEKLREIYPDIPVSFVENGEAGLYEFTDEELKTKYLNQHNMELSTTAYDFVKQLSFKNYDVLYNLITDEIIKYYAQVELLKYENPSISIAEWEYSPVRDKRNWINNNIKSIDQNEIKNLSAREVFNDLRKELKISDDINDYDMRNMMVIRERYNRTSYLSYHPVDICYSISEKSVAMISERSHELVGINVEIEPLRYYPKYEVASHALGYLGKIAQEYEIREYVNENQVRHPNRGTTYILPWMLHCRKEQRPF